MHRYILATLLACSSVTSHATLLGRAPLTPGGTDYQAIYDTDRDITWLSNANLGATTTFGVAGVYTDGSMIGSVADAWLAAMNSANYLGVNNWRRPDTVQPDPTCSYQYGGSYLYNCTGSEMGHLFYTELGGLNGFWIGTVHNSAYGLFKNVKSGSYFSNSIDDTYSWDFDFGDGMQNQVNQMNNLYVWAVRSGDIGAVSQVPIPAAIWLFGGALGALGALKRRTRA